MRRRTRCITRRDARILDVSRRPRQLGEEQGLPRSNAAESSAGSGCLRARPATEGLWAPSSHWAVTPAGYALPAPQTSVGCGGVLYDGAAAAYVVGVCQDQDERSPQQPRGDAETGQSLPAATAEPGGATHSEPAQQHRHPERGRAQTTEGGGDDRESAFGTSRLVVRRRPAPAPRSVFRDVTSSLASTSRRCHSTAWG